MRPLLLLLLISSSLVLNYAQKEQQPSPPKRRVEIAPSGGFRVNGEPFFPVGFYYIWQAIRGEGDKDGSPKGPNGRPPRTDVTTNASKWPTAEAFWVDYYKSGFNTFTVGWMGATWLGGYGQMLEYLQDDLGTGIMPILNVGNTQQVYNAHPPKPQHPSLPPLKRLRGQGHNDGAPPSAGEWLWGAKHALLIFAC